MYELVLVFLSLVVIHYKFRDTMNDLLENMQGVYKKWEAQAPPEIREGKAPLPKMSYPGMNYNGIGGGGGNGGGYGDNNGGIRFRKISSPVFTQFPNSRHSKERKRSMPLMPRVSSLSQFKMSPVYTADSINTRPFMGSCCNKCVPLSRKSLTVDEVIRSLGMKNLLEVDSWKKSNSNILSKYFKHIKHVMCTKEPFHYPDVQNAVLSSQRVQESVEMSTTQEMEELSGESIKYGLLKNKHQKRAIEVLKRMKASISRHLLRLADYVLFKLLGRLLTSIQINLGQIEMLRRAHKASIPIIYVPLHRSHLDYILLSFIFVNFEIKAPHVAAGDNLRIFFFGSLMRGLGAFFIKRKLDPKAGQKDLVYRSILHTYMEQILQRDCSVEFFIEGGRSRNGKACLPKAGLLSVVVDALLDGVIDDAYIVPVGINYEKILEGNYFSEQMGKTKQMESFIHAVKSIWKVLHSSFGSVRVDFGQPYSLKEFVQAAQQYSQGNLKSIIKGDPNDSSNIRRFSSNTSLYGVDIVIEDQRTLVKGLADHILFDAINSQALMSTNLVAFLLLNKYREGVSMNALVVALDELRQELSTRQRDVGFTGESADVIEYAVQLLGKNLILKETVTMDTKIENGTMEITLLKPNLKHPQILELSYYSNVTISVFQLDSVVATVLLILIQQQPNQQLSPDENTDVKVSFQSLKDKSVELCAILQYEFLFTPPCTPLETLVTEAIQRLMACDILSMNDDGEDAVRRQWALRMARAFEFNEGDSEEEDYYSDGDDDLTVHLNDESREKLRFHKNIVASFIEGYWQLGLNLHRLVQQEMVEAEFVKFVIEKIKERAEQGLVTHTECIAAEIVRNGLKLLEKYKVIDSYQHGNVKVIYLNEYFDSEEKLSDVLELFEEFKL